MTAHIHKKDAKNIRILYNKLGIENDVDSHAYLEDGLLVFPTITQEELDAALQSIATAGGVTRTKTEVVESISELEASLTPRTMREAILGDKKALALVKDVNDKIIALRLDHKTAV